MVDPRPFLAGYEARFAAHREAIFEFGRGFYGNTYTPVLSDLTLTPDLLHIFVTASDATESWAGPWNEADIRTAIARKVLCG